MVSKKTDLDAGIERLYRGPLDAFTSARNDLVKQLRKLGGKDGKEDAERVRGLAKPTLSAWAVNVLFERESERMGALLAAGERARAGQREAVSGRGVEALRTSLGEVRGLIDELRRRGAALLAESGRAVSRTVIERIGTDLQALALSPDAEAAASRHWLDQDLDPPGFEVLAGLQLAGAPVVDLAARRAEREEKKAPAPAPKKPAREVSKDDEGREQRKAVERAHREREEERRRRRIEVAEEKAGRAREEAESLRAEAETAEASAAEAQRRAEAAELAANRARDKADRAAERLARAETDVKEAKAER
jgi:hypothetical protein